MRAHALLLFIAAPLAAQQPAAACHADTLGVDTLQVGIYAFGPPRADSTTPEGRFRLAQTRVVLARLPHVFMAGAPDRPDTLPLFRRDAAFPDSIFQGAETVVWFQVRNDGRLIGLHIERHSRYSAIDMALQQAVLKADSDHALLPLSGPLINQPIDLYVAAGSKRAVRGDSVLLGIRREVEAKFEEKRPQFVREHYRPHFPNAAIRAHVVDTIMVEFVIDTTGHAEPSSIRFVRGTYREFAEEAQRAILGSEYLPGLIGACKVRVRVQQPVNFGFGY